MMHVSDDAATGTPAILFGAFDRHNFGDLLFPHILAALLPDRELYFAGLAARDLRAVGGHRVATLGAVAAQLEGRPFHIIHAGGELLTCSAWEAAVMLLPPEEARDVIARLDARARQRGEWAQRALGSSALAPYTIGREQHPGIARMVYHAVGGVGLDGLDAAMRTEVLGKLAAADEVSVRDIRTHALLEAAGITARLVPDPAVMVAELFGARIRQQAQQGEVARMLDAFPNGYIAVQFSADFGDDRKLEEIAAQLDRTSAVSGCGVAFFCAGVAPWHDDSACYHRVAARMRSPAKILSSPGLWDICSVIASGRAYCGSSLHGRIVAMAFGLPRVNLHHPAGGGAKQAAFVETWEQQGMPGVEGVESLADSIGLALATSRRQREQTARALAARYRHAFERTRAGLQ